MILSKILPSENKITIDYRKICQRWHRQPSVGWQPCLTPPLCHGWSTSHSHPTSSGDHPVELPVWLRFVALSCAGTGFSASRLILQRCHRWGSFVSCRQLSRSTVAVLVVLKQMEIAQDAGRAGRYRSYSDDHQPHFGGFLIERVKIGNSKAGRSWARMDLPRLWPPLASSPSRKHQGRHSRICPSDALRRLTLARPYCQICPSWLCLRGRDIDQPSSSHGLICYFVAGRHLSPHWLLDGLAHVTHLWRRSICVAGICWQTCSD